MDDGPSGDDAQDDDEDLRNDPIAQIDMAVGLSLFLTIDFHLTPLTLRGGTFEIRPLPSTLTEVSRVLKKLAWQEKKNENRRGVVQTRKLTSSGIPCPPY